MDLGGSEPPRAAVAATRRDLAAGARARPWVAPLAVAAVTGTLVFASAATVVLVRRGNHRVPPAAAGTPLPASPPAEVLTATASVPTTLATPSGVAIGSSASPPPSRTQAVPPPDRTPAAARSSAPPRRADLPAPDVANAVAALLTEAEAAVSDGQCQLALGFYAEALRLDPANERARLGRQFCGTAREAPRAAAAPLARAFVSGQTHQAGEAVRRGPVGFEDSAGVAVRRLEVAMAPAGKILFEIEPRELGPGDRFTLRAYLVNEGVGPLDVRQVSATTTVNGRQASGGLPVPARPIPPGDKATLLSLEDVWKADVTSWSLALAVRVASGDLYANELTWK